MQNIYDNYQGVGIENLSEEVDYRLNLNTDVDYKRGVCPIAEKMHYEEIMTTDICKYPNSERDVKDFCEGIHKIAKNSGKLKSIET